MATERRRRGRQDGCAGFTLLEVIVAFAIVALALVVLLGVFSQGLSGSAASERTSLALLRAESRLAALGVSAPLDAGRRDGAYPDGARWRTVVRPYRVPERVGEEAVLTRAFEVEVAVAWPGADAADGVRLVTLRLAATAPARAR